MLSSGQGQYVDAAYLEVLHQWPRTPNLYNTLILWAQHCYGWKNVKGLSHSALYFSSPVSMKSLFHCVLLKQTASSQTKSSTSAVFLPETLSVPTL